MKGDYCVGAATVGGRAVALVACRLVTMIVTIPGSAISFIVSYTHTTSA